MRARSGCIASVGALLAALLLAGCQSAEAPDGSPAALAPGDFQAFVLETEGTQVGSALHAVAGAASIPTADGEVPGVVLAKWFLDADAEEPQAASITEWAGLGGEFLGRRIVLPDSSDSEVRSSVESVRAPCPFVEWPLREGAAGRVSCARWIQQVALDGSSTWFQQVTETRDYRVTAWEAVEVPAGRFEAWRIETSTVYVSAQQSPRVDEVHWYSPAACGIVRTEDTHGFALSLAAYRCAGREVALPAGFPEPSAVPFEAEALGGTALEAAVFRTCQLRPVYAGVGPAGLDPFMDSCDADEAFGGLDVAAFERVRVELNWTETTALQVHLTAAGSTASGMASPLVLEIPASAVDEAFEARVTTDGASNGDRFTLRFDLLAP